MHTHTIRTKFTFGDRVRYQSRSPFNGSGTGRVAVVTFDASGYIDYMIELSDGSIQGGIAEDEMTRITDDAESDVTNLLSSPRSGDGT